MKEGSIFVITGGASGIGAATAELVVGRGHRAVVCDVDEESAWTLCKKLGEAALPIQLDVRAPASWERALDEVWGRFGGADVLVNNAGLTYTGWVQDQRLHRLEHMLEVNLLGVVKGVRAVTPRFVAQGYGHIVNLGSIAGFVPLPGQTFYAATKHAVRAFHHGVALELRDTPVTLTLVCPGAVDTPMLRQQIDDDAAALSFADAPLTPQQVAEAVYRAAEKRPREILIPAARGEMLRIAGVYPGLVARLVDRAAAQGRKAMTRLRNRP